MINSLPVIDFNYLLSSFFNSYFFNIFLLTIIHIITWKNCINGQPLIDEDFGIFAFSERFTPEGKDPKGVIIPEKKIDSYQEGEKSHKFLSYQPHLGIPGAFMRWHRLHIGKRFAVIGKDKKGHEVYGYIQDPKKHHIWSLVVHYITCISIYVLLNRLFGHQIALFATLLFITNPISSQCVAWISGINYIYSLFFGICTFIIVTYVDNYHVTIPGTIALGFASSMTLLTGCFNCVILLLLGHNWEAFTSIIVSALVFMRDGLGVVSFRKKNFKEQNMERSTFISIRKPIVMMKTFWYYLKLMLIPSNLGLYHTFGYHYEEKIEKIDSMF